MTIDQLSSRVQPEKQRLQPSAIVQDIIGSAAVSAQININRESAASGASTPFHELEEGVRENLWEKFNTDGFIKEAPRFIHQLDDDQRSRSNEVTIVDPRFNSSLSDTSKEIYADHRLARSEHELLHQFSEYLTTVFAYGSELPVHIVKIAQELRDDLTFIGEKERQEACRGLAEYWKQRLEKSPEEKLFIVTAQLKKDKQLRDPQAEDQSLKSDEYLLDNILEYFSPEEMERYKQRLFIDSADLPDDIDAAVLLDDWPISGTQLRDAADSLVHQIPHLEGKIEVHAVVARADRLEEGLGDAVLNEFMPQTRDLLPVKAYYKAHEAPTAEHLARITGAHSAVDYDFRDALLAIANAIKSSPRIMAQMSPEEVELVTHVPELANVVRPYRMNGYQLSNIDQFRSFSRS